MNGPFPTSQQLTSMPAAFELLAPAPLLLPGESLEHYKARQQAIIADIAPQSAIEWLLAIDIAQLSREIQRYRVLRHKLLGAYRQKAVEAGRYGGNRPRVREGGRVP